MDQKTFDIIEKISKEHCNKTFGYLDKNDLKNEIWVICLEKLKEFDYTRGELEHFLRVSVKTRLVNKFKDITKSVRLPCPRCPFYRDNPKIDNCIEFKSEKHLCDKWKNYKLSVESRNSLLNSAEQQGERSLESNTLDYLVSKEIKQQILDDIDVKYLHDFEQLIDGGKLSRQRLRRLKKEIDRIINKE